MTNHRSAVSGLVLALGIGLLLSACRLAGLPGGGSTDPSQVPDPTASGAIEHPAGDAVVLQVRWEGGFVPVDYLFSSFPSFTLLGDGRVLTLGAQPAIYPGPALPAVLERRLTESGIQAVLRLALDSGQLDRDADWRANAYHVSDASDTVFTIDAAGRSATVSVYALGMLDAQVPDDERRAQQALQDLATRLQDLESWLPANAWTDADWSAYRPERIGLLVRNTDAEAGDASGLARMEAPWPISADPATFGVPWGADAAARCGVVEGADAEAWYAALSAANQLTRFTRDGHAYAVTPRLVIPGEQPCSVA